MKFNLKKGNLTVYASLLLINSSLILTGCSNQNNNSIIESTGYNIEYDNSMDSFYNEKSNDEIIIEYYQSMESEIQEMLQSDNPNMKQKVSEKVVILVDFLFYGGEIKGITASEISDETKEQLLIVTTTIDEKIESKFPGYKDSIANKTSDALEFIKEKGSNAIDKLDDYLNQKIDNYSDIKDDTSSIISDTKNDVGELTDLAKQGFSKAKDYYENWRSDVKDNIQ